MLHSARRPTRRHTLHHAWLGLAALGSLGLLGACDPPKRPARPDARPLTPLHTKALAPAMPPTALPQAAAAEKKPAPPYQAKTPTATAGPFSFVDGRKPQDAADARKKPFDLDALYRVRSVSDPQVSPDGRHVAFVLTSYALESGKSNADLYLVDTDGKTPPRRLTRHAGYDARPRWSPDGRWLLFVSAREKGMQAWRLPLDGGEAERLTNLSTGVDQAEWAPDGRHLLVVSSVYPEHGSDDAANKKALKARKNNPIKAHLANELFYRHWTSWREGRRSHVLLYSLHSKRWRDLTPGDFDSPTPFAEPGFSASPDGRELCVVSQRPRNESERAYSTNKDLWVIPLVGGTAINLTAQNAAADEHPRYSPDGRYIAFLRQEVAGHESDRFRLALYDRKSGKVRVLTEAFDNWVLDFAWAADSHSLVFRGAERGRFPLYRVTVETAQIEKLAPPSSRAFALAKDGRIAFTFDRVSAPLELFIADAKGAGAKRLTSFNHALAERHDLRPVEELWIPGADGRKVHTFVVKPHGFKKGRRYPLIVNVHGGPQYQWADNFRGDWQIYPGSGYVVAFPNPHGSIGYGQAYTAAISKDYTGKVFTDIDKVTEALSKLPYVDAKRVGAMGWSWGGYAMAWLGGHSNRYKALAAMMPVYDLRSFYGATEELWFPEWDLGGPPWQSAKRYEHDSPSNYASRFKTPTLVLTGERDYRVPYTQGLQLFTALRRQGVPARLIVFENDGHWPSVAKSMPLYYAAHLDWFHRYLRGSPPRYRVEDLVSGTAFSKKQKKAAKQ